MIALALAGCGPGDEGEAGLRVDSTVEVRVGLGEPADCLDETPRAERHMDESVLAPEPRKEVWQWAGGLAVADVDGDGWFDLVEPGYWQTRYHRGLPGGRFEEVPGAFPDDYPLASGSVLADIDGDADLDLLLTRFDATNVLLRNDGGTWVDTTAEAGLSDEARKSVPASFGDLDHDGDLDLWIGNYGWVDESLNPSLGTFGPAEPDWLYLNRGDGTFEDVSDRLPQATHDGYALAGGFHDLDGDGWVDLYPVFDFGQSFPNLILWNRQGELVPGDGDEGLGVGITGMGLGVGDVNEDGVDDLLMTAWGYLAFLHSSGGRWVDHTDAVGVHNDLSRGQKLSWGTELVDMNDDGRLDAPTGFGWLDTRYPNPFKQPDALWIQQPDGTFVDEAPAWRLNHPTVSRGFVAADLNRDGWPDLVKRDLAGGTLVEHSRCGTASWVRVVVDQGGPNPFAVGARIFATDVRGRSQVRTVRAGGTNYGATSGPGEAHFGLGDQALLSVSVVWPDGETTAVEGVGARRTVTIHRTGLAPR